MNKYLSEIFEFSLKTFDLWGHPHVWVDGSVNWLVMLNLDLWVGEWVKSCSLILLADL